MMMLTMRRRGGEEAAVVVVVVVVMMVMAVFVSHNGWIDGGVVGRERQPLGGEVGRERDSASVRKRESGERELVWWLWGNFEKKK